MKIDSAQYRGFVPRICKPDISKFNTAPNRTRGGQGAGLCNNPRLDLEEIQQVHHKKGLVGYAGKCGEKRLNVGACSSDGPGKERHLPEGQGPDHGLINDERVRSVVADCSKNSE